MKIYCIYRTFSLNQFDEFEFGIWDFGIYIKTQKKFQNGC